MARSVIRTSEAVRGALEARRPVVALETSVLAQGLPHPRNLEAAERMSGVILEQGAVPAWTAVVAGAVRVGLDDAELERLATTRGVVKVARRDLPAAVAGGGLGATTVSAALWLAHRSEIHVMATGGIGGVHGRGGDVSADLMEMARTPGLVVCSGPKSIVDPLATLERLDEVGVAVIGYRTSHLPHFLADTELALEHRANTPSEAAGVARARRELELPAAIVLCNPCPPDSALDPAEVAAAVGGCEEEARRRGLRGKELTPFLLSCMAERTDGASLEANLALLEANAALAAEVAAALAGPA
jgi:pseudouridylate synthase